MKLTLKIAYLFSLLLLCSGIMCPQTTVQNFQNLGNAITKPWTYWWWLGSAVDSQSITYNLEKFASVGIGGVHIIPIYGTKGYEEKFIDFLSPKWMEMLAYTSKECERLGIGLDMTLGTGWPFGGPQVSVENASSKLIDVILELKDDSEVNLNIIAEAKKKAKPNCELSILAVNSFSAKGHNDLIESVDGQGNLKWKPDCDNCKIIALVIAAPVQQVKRAAKGGVGNVLDPFSVKGLNKYLNSFDEAFENYNGKMPNAFYHDSYEYYDADWSRNFLNEFKKRRNYDLLDMLPEFFGEGDSDIIARVKCDYRQTIAQLHEEFIQTTTEWSHKYGSLFRNQAHGSPTNILDVYAAADIPETEVFGAPKTDIPGMIYDSLYMASNAIIDPMLLKFSSSAAHVSGKKYVSSETGTWVAEHFHESLSKLKPEIDLLFLSGINHIYFHGIPYSPKEEEFPGWQFYASTNYGPNNSLWHDLSFFTKYIELCQSVLQEGRPDNDLLIYFPVWDLWNSAEGGLKYLQMHNPDQWLFHTNFYKTASALADKGYSFDFISDKQIENIKLDSDKILSGENEYKAVLIPSCKFIPLSTLNKLKELAENGGRIIFADQIPSDVPGYYNYEKRRGELSNSKREIEKLEGKNNENLVIGNDVISKLEDFGIMRESVRDFNINFVRRKTNEYEYYFLANQSAKKLDNWVKLAHPDETILIINPLDGKTGKAKTRKDENGYVSVYLQIEPGASLVLKCFPEEVEYSAWTYLQSGEKTYELNGEWSVEFIQGGPVLPNSTTIGKLESWTDFGDTEAKRFGGTARYKFAFQNPDAKVNNWILDLGKVCESARVKINGKELGALWSFPFKMPLQNVLKEGENEMEIEVTNLYSNRIKDLDQRGVNWKKFYDINFVNIRYKKFDASNWNLADSGLLGPVKLIPAKIIN